MIKCAATREGEPLVVLGLSDANVKELRNDRPIRFSLSELGLPDKTVVISYGHANGRAAKPDR